MSRSKKWKTEWSFFLGENGRRQYNPVFRKCVHGCKQSFRASLVACPLYRTNRIKKGAKGVENKGIFPLYRFRKKQVIGFTLILPVSQIGQKKCSF